MNQETCNQIISSIQDNTDIKVAVMQSVRISLKYPDLAKYWFESLPKATLDNKKLEIWEINSDWTTKRIFNSLEEVDNYIKINSGKIFQVLYRESRNQPIFIYYNHDNRRI